MKETYRCWAEIDRAALRHNAKVVRDRIGSAEMLAVVKANAYGHGLVGVAEALADEAQLFGVANLQEALTLRETLRHPIIILGPATPEERPVIAEHGFIPTISGLEEAQAFDQLKAVSVNFKIDTGMGRMGVVQNEAREVFQRVAGMANLEIHSISTHMPVSNEDAKYTQKFWETTRHTCYKAPAHSRSISRPSKSCAPVSCSTAFRRSQNFVSC